MANRNSTREDEATGPIAWKNWQAERIGRPARGAAEYALYTDARLRGEILDSCGPFQILNTLPVLGSTDTRVNSTIPRALVLRVGDHLSADDHRMATWLEDADVDDEMSALVSLALGVRIKAAGLTRRFWANGDPMGAPFEYAHRRPYLPQADPGSEMVPPRSATTELEAAAHLLKVFGEMPPVDASALVRASRSFREAIWIADGDPREAWIRLVTSLEAAAWQWSRARQLTADDLSKALPSSLRQAMTDDGWEGAIPTVARGLERLTGATAKFASFVDAFRPDPPEPRPEDGALDWSDLAPAVMAIYEWRSKALHTGALIPWSMCIAPRRAGNGVWWETVPEMTTQENEGSDVVTPPMLFCTFSYIARGALLRWWATYDLSSPSSKN